MKTRWLFPWMLACGLLAACGADRTNAGRSTGGDAGGDALPAPEAGGGSVTGMPDALPAGSQLPGAEAPATVPSTIEPADGADTDMANDDETPPASPDDGPGPDAAVQVIRDYYSAINRHEYGNAYALWSSQGQASGKSSAQFAEGFADTSGVSVQIGQPGPVDAGAGQRYIEVPVTLVARQVDGREKRFRGTYVLHRTVVDGASADQRAWRIQSASLSEAP